MLPVVASPLLEIPKNFFKLDFNPSNLVPMVFLSVVVDFSFSRFLFFVTFAASSFLINVFIEWHCSSNKFPSLSIVY